MNENLPFINCNDVELSNVLSVERNLENIQNETMPKNKNKCNVLFAQYMPFFKCSDYWIQREYLSNTEKFLKSFENNTFTTICRSFIQDLTKENFSCKYYNENKFNSMLPNHQDNSLKIFHLNVRSINKHCHVLKAYLSCLNSNFDIILLTEIGHANKELIEKVFLDYTLFCDLSKSKKGGAGILVKSDRFDEIETNDNKVIVNCKCSNCKIESIFLNLKYDKNNITIGSVYRHPSGNVQHFNESLNKCINKLNTNNMLVIGGDINIDLLKTNTIMTQNYLDTMLSNNLIPNILIPTRFSDNSTTLIDHIFTRLPLSKLNNMVTAGNLITDITDHLSNFVIIDIEIKRNKERPFIRLYTKKNIELFEKNIESELSDLNETINTQNNADVNELYKSFFEKMKLLLDKYFPRVRQSRKKAKDKDWITDGIKRSIKQKHVLFKIQLTNSTIENRENGENIGTC